jgi:hypothetical protein
VAAVLGALTMAVTACGGGGEQEVTEMGPGGTVLRQEGDATPTTGAADAPADGDGDGGAEPTSEGDGTTEGGGGAADRAAVAGTVVHYDGWVFELGEVRLGPGDPDQGGEPGQLLVVEVLIDNPGRDDEAPPREDFTLQADGVDVPFTVPLTGEGSEPLPVVPSGSRGSGQLVFAGLSADVSLDSTELVFGPSDVHQARVPLGGGDAVTLDPIEVTSPGTGTAGEVTLTITGGRLDYGDTITHYPVPADKAILTLDLDATASAALGGYDRNLQGAHLRLQLPDGTSLATRQDGLSDPNEIIRASSTLQGMRARFEVPADTSGPLQLVLSGTFAADCCTEVEGLVPFELPAAPG